MFFLNIKKSSIRSCHENFPEIRTKMAQQWRMNVHDDERVESVYFQFLMNLILQNLHYCDWLLPKHLVWAVKWFWPCLLKHTLYIKKYALIRFQKPSHIFRKSIRNKNSFSDGIKLLKFDRRCRGTFHCIEICWEFY